MPLSMVTSTPKVISKTSGAGCGPPATLVLRSKFAPSAIGSNKVRDRKQRDMTGLSIKVMEAPGLDNDGNSTAKGVAQPAKKTQSDISTTGILALRSCVVTGCRGLHSRINHD